MTTGYKHLLSALLVASLAACASPRLPVKAIPDAGQTLFYNRGQAQLHAGPEPTIGVGFLGYENHKALIRVQVQNDTDQAVLFGPDNVSGELVSGQGTRQACRVQRFEELVSGDDNAWAWDGASSAVGIAGAVIPSGGIGGTVAQNVLRVGINEGKRQSAEPQEFTLESLQDQYLRLHTLTPGSSYQGLLKVDLPRAPTGGDVLVATIDFGEQQESFSFGFGPSEGR